MNKPNKIRFGAIVFISINDLPSVEQTNKFDVIDNIIYIRELKRFLAPYLDRQNKRVLFKVFQGDTPSDEFSYEVNIQEQSNILCISQLNPIKKK